MHREMPLHWHEVVHQGEDPFLHLAGVFGAQNDHFLFLEADVNRGFRGHAFGEAVGGELARIVNGEIRFAEVG